LSGDDFRRLRASIGRLTWPPYKIKIAAIALVGSMFLTACGLIGPAGE
jgi:hypothetical protein